jgi:hypothetical protein
MVGDITEGEVDESGGYEYSFDHIDLSSDTGFYGNDLVHLSQDSVTQTLCQPYRVS